MPLPCLLRPLTLLVALSGASTVAWAQAQPPAPQQQRHAPVDPQSHPNRDQQGLADSVRRAERSGQVLSAEQVQYDGRDVNRVKIVDDKGRVRVYWDDPAARPQSPPNPQQRRANKPPKGGRTHDDDDGDPTL
jgi:hypothetical protein